MGYYNAFMSEYQIQIVVVAGGPAGLAAAVAAAEKGAHVAEILFWQGTVELKCMTEVLDVFKRCLRTCQCLGRIARNEMQQEKSARCRACQHQ